MHEDILANIKVLPAPVLALAVPPVYKILKALSLYKFFSVLSHLWEEVAR